MSRTCLTPEQVKKPEPKSPLKKAVLKVLHTLPRTGTEYVLMPHTPRFIASYPDCEPLNVYKPTIQPAPEDQQRDEKLVYDYLATSSPFWKTAYLPDEDQIELIPQVLTEDEQIFKAKYGHNITYPLESAMKHSAKLNRYYSKLKPYYKPTGSDDVTLQFESRFESGNLLKATKVSDTEYNLWLK